MTTTTIESSCNSILQKIRTSGLNFSCQETPFSMYVTVRKSLTKQQRSNHLAASHGQPVGQPGEHDHELHVVSPVTGLLPRYEQVLLEKKTMEEACNKSEQILEETIQDSEEKSEVINELRDKNSTQCDEIQKLLLGVIKAESQTAL